MHVLHQRGRLEAAFLAQEPSELVLRFTVLLMTLYGASSRTMQVPLWMICGAMIVLPSLIRNAPLWAMAAAVMIIGHAVEWYGIDNHKYLITYWVLGCAIAVRSGDEADYLPRLAAILVAIAFGAAVLWKVIGGEYVDGRFMYWTLLSDSRWSWVATQIAGIPAGDLAALRDLLPWLGGTASEDVRTPLVQSARLLGFASALSWAVIIGEALVALLHVSRSRRLYALRHAALMAFVIGTYVFLPVSGFAFVLTVLGLAQCDPSDTRRRVAYLLLFAYVQLTALPWQRLIGW